MAVLLVVILQIYDVIFFTLVYNIEQVSLQIQFFFRILSTFGIIISNGEQQVKGVPHCPLLVLAYTGVYTGSVSPDRASALPT